jgi:hypothetical protein
VNRVSDASRLADVTAHMRTVSLDQVLAVADLQTRVDRKYVVPVDTVVGVLEEVRDGLSVLQISQLRLFRYESVYFDTPDLAAYHQHAHDRRRRVKVRTRTYLDSGECVLEFKSVGGRGETIKDRHPFCLAERRDLTAGARALAHERLGHLIDTAALRQVLTTAYRRATFLDTATGSRATCDVDLRFEDGAGRRFGPLDGLVVVESKTRGSDSPVDQALRRRGARPVSLSKYCVGMAVLDPSLPANRWNRELRRHFGWSPLRQPPPALGTVPSGSEQVTGLR